jgi:hypothetical protein
MYNDVHNNGNNNGYNNRNNIGNNNRYNNGRNNVYDNINSTITNNTITNNTITNNTNNNKFYYNLNSSMPYYIQILTHNLDNFKKNNIKGISRSEVEDLFGNEVNQLLTDKNKFSILNKWKYGKSFKLTEEEHANGNILFGPNTSWLQSFIIGLLMYAFH